jgi:uncharacterized protein YgbK (DUF1537 family)
MRSNGIESDNSVISPLQVIIMLDLLVIADDFTGALDAGVQFAKGGLETLISVSTCASLGDSHPTARVLVTNTESRHVTPDDAAIRVKSATELGRQVGIRCFYKKTDSTLRGNIGAELEALIDGTGEEYLVFVPAFPANGRTTVNGYQYVDGVPIHKSPFASDPLNPIEESYVPAIIGKQSAISVKTLSTDDIPQISGLCERAIFVFDAQSDDDMTCIATGLRSLGDIRLFAGCAGFANVLPDVIGLKRQHREMELRLKSTRTLIVCGSVNDCSLDQISYFEKTGVSSITLAPEQVLSTDKAFGIEETLQAIENIWGLQNEIIIRTLGAKADIGSYIDLGRRMGLCQAEIHSLIAENAGRIVSRLIERNEVRCLVVFGGDTAGSIIDTLGCTTILPRTEILPGVAFSEMAWQAGEMCLVTKAGGFGDIDVLVSIMEFIRG